MEGQQDTRKNALVSKESVLFRKQRMYICLYCLNVINMKTCNEGSHLFNFPEYQDPKIAVEVIRESAEVSWELVEVSIECQ